MKKRILLLCLFCMTLGFAYSQELDPQITNMTKVVICTSDKKSLKRNMETGLYPYYLNKSKG